MPMDLISHYPKDVSNYAMNSGRQGFLRWCLRTDQFAQPALGSEGNESVSRFRNPAYYQTDAALLKNTKIFERLNLQLRFESYNVFNQVNLRGVAANLSDFELRPLDIAVQSAQSPGRSEADVLVVRRLATP